MTRRAIAVMVAVCAVWVLAAVPASADPPIEFEDQYANFYPDFASGYWVFLNINRAAFCGGEAAFVGDASFTVVPTPQAGVLRISAPSAPTWLYEIAGPLPEDDDIEALCDAIGTDPVANGTVNLRNNDNEIPTNDGPRANAFGQRAEGTLDVLDSNAMPTGDQVRLSWTSQILIPPGESFDPTAGDEFNPDWVRAEHTTLTPIGSGG